MCQTPIVSKADLQVLRGKPLAPRQVASLRERLARMNQESAQVREIARTLLDLTSAAPPANTESILL